MPQIKPAAVSFLVHVRDSLLCHISTFLHVQSTCMMLPVPSESMIHNDEFADLVRQKLDAYKADDNSMGQVSYEVLHTLRTRPECRS